MIGVEPRRQLSDADTLMWRIEADPVLRSSVLVVGLLDRAPSPTRLSAVVERAADHIPGLKQRLVPPRLGVGPAAWEDVEHLSLEHHLRWIRVTGGDLRTVLALAEPDMTTPFDPERPRWSLAVVEGLDGGAAAFVLRFHHTITDGVGALRLARHLFDTSRRPRAGPPTAAPAPPARGGAPLAARVLGSGATALARSASAAVRDPGAAVTGPLRLARSIGRLLQPVPTPGSPLLSGRGIDRALHAYDVPLADLRAAAAAAGGTVNDVLLAAVAGAFRAYHVRLGQPVATMRVSMPVNLRGRDEPGGGNRFTPTRFVLPVDDPDFVARARIAEAIVRSWRSEPALGLTSTLATGLNLLPGPVVTRIFGGLLKGTDVNVVNLRGLDRPVFLASARVDRLWAFAPPVGAAVSITLLSHGDSGCVSVATDRAAVDDPALFARCVEQALADLPRPGEPGHAPRGPDAAAGRPEHDGREAAWPVNA